MACTWVKMFAFSCALSSIRPSLPVRCACVSACEFMCDVKNSIVYHLSRSDKVQTKVSVHQRCSRRAGSLCCFLPQKKKKKKAKKRIISRYFVELASGRYPLYASYIVKLTFMTVKLVVMLCWHLPGWKYASAVALLLVLAPLLNCLPFGDQLMFN